jgi:NifB/MoaA-like Fe-S oxidoreductase
VHGQIVVCPGVNDGAVLEDTMVGILDEYPELTNVAVVPLGVSRYNNEARMRPHTTEEAAAVVATVHAAQLRFIELLGQPMVFAADEYYLLAGLPFPDAAAYGAFDMHEDGIGMARAFETEFHGQSGDHTIGVQPGFFAWVDGAPAEGYRAPRWEVTSSASESTAVASGAARRPISTLSGSGSTAVELSPRRPRPDAPTGILTGPYGAQVLGPLVASLGRDDVRVIPVENQFFGGNTGVSGLMVGSDLARVLADEPVGHRYLLPDVCLSGGVFLDGTAPGDLPRPVEVIATDGVALRRALDVAVPAGASS